jgi:HEAT repeat protein
MCRRGTILTLVMLVLSMGCATTVENVQQWQAERATDKLIGALEGGSRDVRNAAANALGEIGDPIAVEPLIQACLCGKLSEQTTERALLGITGPRAVQPLIGALGRDNLLASRPAGKALANIGAPAVDPLILALKSRSPVLRENAAGVLGDIGDPRAIEPLRQALADEYCRETISIVGFGGQVAASEPYMRCPVREAAAAALKKLGYDVEAK